MIPNIRRGKNLVGLAAYMVSEGRANEHTNPHLVAGSAPIMAWWSTDILTHEDALAIGAELDQPRRVFDATMDRHVWHCSLSLHADDGIKSDEEWQAMATEFMQEMGFIGVEGKADVRWAAFRHGLSGESKNDHVHLAVNLIREDGTKASPWHDFHKAQTVCRGLEQKYGLMTIIPGRGVPGLTPQEQKAAERKGLVEPERVTLARKVRAFSVASETEAEFVRRCRNDGLLIRPRFEKGSTEAVMGYSIALRPPDGLSPVFKAGSKLGKDLGLGSLRMGWRETPESAAEAVAEWQAAKFGKRITRVGREGETLDGNELLAAAGQLEALREKLRDVPLTDHEQWRRTASFLAGAFASWSQATEPTPGPLAHVADELARSAQVNRDHYQPKPSHGPMGLRTATALAMAAHGHGAAAGMAVFTQMSYLMRALHDYNVSRGDVVRQNGMTRAVREDLAAVSARLREAAGPQEGVVAGAGVAPGRVNESVVGSRLARHGAVKEAGADLSR